MCTAVVRTIKLVTKRSFTLSQCALAGSVYTGMPLVDPVYTGILLGDPANVAGYTGTPLEKRSWNCPTLECHWRNSDHGSLLWNTTGGTVTAHKHTWDLSSKWIGLCKFSFNLEFTALQWISVLLFKRVSTSTSLYICLGYEHHYSFCVYGLQFKWNQLNSTNSRHTSCMHKGLYAEKWPDLVTLKPDSVSTLGYHWADCTGTTLADAITVIQSGTFVVTESYAVRAVSESYAVRISVRISRICEFRVIMGIMTGLLRCCSSSTIGSRANDNVKTLGTLGFWLHHSPCSVATQHPRSPVIIP